jgi:hypothetical protein
MNSNLIILDVCITDRNLPSDQQGWQEPIIFNEDTDEVALNLAIKEARDKRYTVSMKVIHGMAVEPLKKYLRDQNG